jgi:hypothetical protein
MGVKLGLEGKNRLLRRMFGPNKEGMGGRPDDEGSKHL